MGKRIPLHTAPSGPIGNARPIKPHVIAPAAAAGKKRTAPHVTGYAARPGKTRKASAPGGAADYLPAFKFGASVRVGDELIRFGFTKISGISSAVETQAIREGGVNDRVYLLPGVNEGERKITLESGVVYSESGKTPAEKLERYFRPGRRLDYVLIEIFGRDGKPYRRYAVGDAVVSHWSLQELNAMSGQLGFQQFEISYGKLVYA